jgi:hypothetical protein
MVFWIVWDSHATNHYSMQKIERRKDAPARLREYIEHPHPANEWGLDEGN